MDNNFRRRKPCQLERSAMRGPSQFAPKVAHRDNEQRLCRARGEHAAPKGANSGAIRRALCVLSRAAARRYPGIYCPRVGVLEIPMRKVLYLMPVVIVAVILGYGWYMPDQ